MLRRALIACLLLAAAPALADEGLVGSYRFTGTEGGRALKGTAVVRASDGGLVFSGGPLGRRGQVELPGTPDGTFAPDDPPAPSVGLSGAIGGLGEAAPAAAPAPSYSLRLARTATAGTLSGQLLDGDGRVIGKLTLTRRKRALIAHATGYEASHDQVFKVYARLIKQYYAARGMEVVVMPADAWQPILDELRRAGDSGETYVRVVTIGHGGWDGPIFHGQLSPWYGGDGWSSLVAALTHGTAPEARMYASACHAAGSDRWERHAGTRPHDSWVDQLARATGRTVAGPAGITSTTLALRQARALEGAGVTAQETRVASADGVKVVGPGGSVTYAKKRTWAQVDEAAAAASPP